MPGRRSPPTRPWPTSLARALADPVPARLEDGGAIRAGFDGELDAHRTLRDESRQVIATLQLDFAQRFGVASLKIKHHAQLGYIIEAPAVAVEKLRGFPELTLRQGMANGARFTTPELSELDQRIREAAEQRHDARASGVRPSCPRRSWRTPMSWPPAPTPWRCWMRRSRQRNWPRAAHGCGRC